MLHPLAVADLGKEPPLFWVKKIYHRRKKSWQGKLKKNAPLTQPQVYPTFLSASLAVVKVAVACRLFDVSGSVT